MQIWNYHAERECQPLLCKKHFFTKVRFDFSIQNPNDRNLVQSDLDILKKSKLERDYFIFNIRIKCLCPILSQKSSSPKTKISLFFSFWGWALVSGMSFSFWRWAFFLIR